MSVLHNKNLLVISDCVHYIYEGRLCNHNPIFTKQMTALFTLFGKVTLITPHGDMDLGTNNLSYYEESPTSSKLFYVPTPNVGGNSILDKLKLVKTFYLWIKIFFRYKNNDLFYLRMPNNLNIISFLFYRILSKKIFITYTGTWANYAGEPFTYRIQKWFITNLHKGVAFIYLPTDTAHLKGGRIIASYSPSNSKVEIEEMQKIRSNKKIDTKCVKFLSVGAVVKYKNQLKSLEVIRFLNKHGINAQISFAGKLSDYHAELLKYQREHQLMDKVIFYGHLSAPELQNLYMNNDFLIHTPTIEGYGKIIQEGFMYGLPAILTDFPYADYFKGNTNRVYILKDTAGSYMGLLDYIKQYCASQNCRTEVLNDINSFLSAHSVDYWVDQYKKAIQDKLIVSNVP